MSESAPTAVPPVRKEKRWTRFVVGAGALIVLTLASSIALMFRDESAPDLSGLQPPARRTIAAEENAFEALAAAAQAVNKSAWASEPELFAAVTNGEKWDPTKATEWLAANAHVWPLLERALALHLSQGPTFEAVIEGKPPPSPPPFQDLARLAMLRAWAAHHSGRNDEALRSAAGFLPASTRIIDSNSTVLTWMMGLRSLSITRQTIDRLTLRSEFSVETARHVLDELDRLPSSAHSLANALRREFTFSQSIVREFPRSASLIGDEAFERAARPVPWSALLFKRNETLRIHATAMRAAIAGATADWRATEAHPASLETIPGLDRAGQNPTNALGRALIFATVPTVNGMLKHRVLSDAAVAATRSAIALRAYEITHGALPPTLTEAMAPFQQPVPLDPFDGAPLRYSKEWRAVWSIGPDNLSATADTADSASGVPDRVFVRLPGKK